MAMRCDICGKGPVVGRRVSHAHNVRPRRFEPNLQSVRAVVNGGVKRMRVCTRCIRSRRSSRPRRCGEAVSSPGRARPPSARIPPAIRAGNLLFLSGQIPLDPATGQLVAGDIRPRPPASWRTSRTC